MVTLLFIGNLAADAEVKEANGQKWLTFRIADTRRFIDSQGKEKEVTQWASCIQGYRDGSKLADFMKKGIKVAVYGSCDLEVYSSPKLRCMTARYNISVQHIELCGGSSEDVPKRLATSDGVLVDVNKAYYVNRAPLGNFGDVLYATAGKGMYTVDQYGYVWPINGEPAEVPAGVPAGEPAGEPAAAVYTEMNEK